MDRLRKPETYKMDPNPPNTEHERDLLIPLNPISLFSETSAKVSDDSEKRNGYFSQTREFAMLLKGAVMSRELPPPRPLPPPSRYHGSLRVSKITVCPACNQALFWGLANDLRSRESERRGRKGITGKL